MPGYDYVIIRAGPPDQPHFLLVGKTPIVHMGELRLRFIDAVQISWSEDGRSNGNFRNQSVHFHWNEL